MGCRKYKCILIIIFTVITGFSKGQSGSWQFRNFNIEDGLPNNNILSINQDSLEYIWIGTEAGLSRYNGVSFHNYINIAGDSNSLPGNSIRQLFVDSKNRLLIGTSGGFCYYDIISRQF